MTALAQVAANPFDPASIDTLDSLDTDWPAFTSTTTQPCAGAVSSPGLDSNQQAWQASWYQYGTCSANVLPATYDYFSTADSLYQNYNILVRHCLLD